ncbi:MAG TPA: hypothetical protein VD866_27185 [Urbifossiella sp.]|nr:hypothetical protein [Urbifossiella sp.]
MNPKPESPPVKPPLTLRVTDGAGHAREYVAVPSPTEPPSIGHYVVGFRVRRRTGEVFPGSDTFAALDEAVARWVAAGCWAFELLALGVGEGDGGNLETTWLGTTWSPWSAVEVRS